MMRWLAIVTLAAQTTAFPSLDVSLLTLSPPALVCELGDRLTLMDQQPRRKVVATIKGVSMPAWSGDGTRLAFLQKAGKKRDRLMTAAVGRATI